jgi:nucleoside 2-deoxyribosyltransferase
MAKKYEYFGIEWEGSWDHLNPPQNGKARIGPDYGSYYYLKNGDLGTLFVSDNALKHIPASDFHKIRALVFEYKLKKDQRNLMLVVREEEEMFKSKYADEQFAVISVDAFLGGFPAGLDEKKCRALYLLYLQYPSYGDKIANIRDYALFAKDEQERGFILRSMVDSGLLRPETKQDANAVTPPFYIGDKGWEKLDAILKTKARKQVFIAMKFKGMDNIKNAIKNAVQAAHFVPNRIDEKEHINNISGEIQHDIRQSGLVVADLTGQNLGVYFEAGYAMGLNIPVILCCRETEQVNIHFDICQYNTILYADETDLEKRLTDRITAVMGMQDG